MVCAPHGFARLFRHTLYNPGNDGMAIDVHLLEQHTMKNDFRRDLEEKPETGSRQRLHLYLYNERILAQ